jgi:hypothetical protein
MYDGVDSFVVPVDLRQMRVKRFDGGYFSRSDCGGKVGGRGEDEVHDECSGCCPAMTA